MQKYDTGGTGMQKAKKYVMALDQGTTSSRCILFDRSGKVCSVAQKEFAQYYPQPGWVEHNPMEIWSSQLSVAVEAMGQIGAEADDIAAIGITNQRETTICFSKRPENRFIRRLYGSAGGQRIRSTRSKRTVLTK